MTYAIGTDDIADTVGWLMSELKKHYVPLENGQDSETERALQYGQELLEALKQ